MGKRWVAPDGWDVEVIRLNGRECFRVRHHGVLEGYCTSMADLQRLLERSGIALADLAEPPPPPPPESPSSEPPV